jgi:transglutaminase-like putative cysteine protease
MIFRFALKWKPQFFFVLESIRPARKTLSPARIFESKSQSPFEQYLDGFGNICGRVHCKPGIVRFVNQGLIRDSGQLDAYEPSAAQDEVYNLPQETLVYLLPNRYREVDSELANYAWANFSTTPLGWSRVQAICDFVHGHIQFDYQKARATRTAPDAFRERVGVCRDFRAMAIASLIRLAASLIACSRDRRGAIVCNPCRRRSD